MMLLWDTQSKGDVASSGDQGREAMEATVRAKQHIERNTKKLIICTK